jgi:hypothetical protein
MAIEDGKYRCMSQIYRPASSFHGGNIATHTSLAHSAAKGSSPGVVKMLLSYSPDSLLCKKGTTLAYAYMCNIDEVSTSCFKSCPIGFIRVHVVNIPVEPSMYSCLRGQVHVLCM